jgi:hypothetical protein
MIDDTSTSHARFAGRRERVQPEHIGREVDHEHLWAVTIRLPANYEPYGYRKCDDGEDETWHGDCSMGCRWCVRLAGRFGMDWGVCTNPDSHRCGLLTFPHQGCPAFEPADDATAE